jgi:hypothetical protein
MITITCPACHLPMDIEDNDLNTEWECPTCEAAFRVQKSADARPQFSITEPGKRPAEHKSSGELPSRERTGPIVLLAAVFYLIWLVYMFLSPTSFLVKVGAVFAAAGSFRLIIQVANIWEKPSCVLFSIFIPFYTWYFAFRNWSIAMPPFICSLIGTAIIIVAGLAFLPQ